MKFLQPEFLKPLEDNFESILEEYEQIKNYIRVEWPEKELHNGKWTVLDLIGFGVRSIENCSRSPKTVEILDSIDIPFIAGYSFLEPGCVIKPHTGYTDDVIRVHLGLDIPSSNPSICGITVGGETRSWIKGKVFAFNDRIEHNAWNYTDKPRAVLLVDYPRDLFNV